MQLTTLCQQTSSNLCQPGQSTYTHTHQSVTSHAYRSGWITCCLVSADKSQHRIDATRTCPSSPLQKVCAHLDTTFPGDEEVGAWWCCGPCGVLHWLPSNTKCQRCLLSPLPPQLLQALAAAVLVYYNYTGSVSCLNVSVDATGSLGEQGWDFQACTEMVMPMCTNGVEDMFPPQPVSHGLCLGLAVLRCWFEDKLVLCTYHCL